MIFKSVMITEGVAERLFEFSNGVNLVYSRENGCGKTTLLRFMLYSLGYNMPNTQSLKYDRCHVRAVVCNDDGAEITLTRDSADRIVMNANGEEVAYELPKELFQLHSSLFGTENQDILKNLPGAIYADQERGWAFLNRGIVVGSIRFNIKELIRGLSDCNCTELVQSEAALSRKIEKYKQMFSFAKYREDVLKKSGTLVIDPYDEEADREKAKLLMREKQLQNELSRIDRCLTDNNNVRKFIGSMKLSVQVEGNVIPVTVENIVGFTDTLDFLVFKRKIVDADLRQVETQLTKLRNEQRSENEQLAFYQSPELIDIFDSKIASIPIDMVKIEEEITKLDKERKAIRQALDSVTKSNTDIVVSLYNNAVKYATELGVENSELVIRLCLFTYNYKELSGAILHKTAYACRLAYIREVERKLGIKLPILLDSPRGNEVDEVNTNRMMDILKRDFSANQIVIASIFEYDFDSPNVIELHNRLLDV